MSHIPVLSFKESILFDVFCALVVHKVYNKHEIDPANLVATVSLLIVVPALPSYFLMRFGNSATIAVFWSYALFYASLALSVVLYRISPMHPLSSYPGPFAMKLTKLVWTYHASTGKQYRLFKSLHDKYGSVVRIGPNELSIIDSESISSLMSLRKGPLWVAHGIPGTTPSITALQDVEVHHQRRKLWNQGFTTAALKELQPFVENRVLELVDELRRHAFPPSGEEKVDLALWMSNFTYDVMGDMVLSGSFSLMRDGDKGGTRALIEDFIVRNDSPDLSSVIGILQHTPWVIALIHKLSAVPERTRKFRDFAFQHYDMRRAKSAAKRDLFHYITNEEGLENVNVPRDQGLNDVLTAIGGGADTSSTALAAIFFYLLSNPAVYARLRKEVDREFPIENGDPFDTLKLARLAYLNAVINEALRLQPPIPTSVQRCPLQGSAGAMVAGRVVPESTILYLPPYLHHRDERYFSPSPNSFIPERWLETDSDKYTTDTSAFIPFSAGRANCVGKNFALMEMRMVVAALVQRFEMKFADGYDPLRWEEDLKEFFVMKVGELPVVLCDRF